MSAFNTTQAFIDSGNNTSYIPPMCVSAAPRPRNFINRDRPCPSLMSINYHSHVHLLIIVYDVPPTRGRQESRQVQRALGAPPKKWERSGGRSSQANRVRFLGSRDLRNTLCASPWRCLACPTPISLPCDLLCTASWFAQGTWRRTDSTREIPREFKT